MERKIQRQLTGYKTKDGAGVSLVRVLGHETVKDYDPILMLDSFDSVHPEDYTAGFPMHPHRGIETISYIYKGQMTHKDSLGNEDTVVDGEIQWMTAGSGIFHEEKLPACERLLGVQLWLNLPAKDKMVAPAYHRIKASEIKEIILEDGKLRLLAGQYQDHLGYTSAYLPLDYYDIHLNQKGSLKIETEKNRSVMIFTLIGDVYVGGELVKEKTAVKLNEGNHVIIKAKDKNVQVLFISSTKLEETIAWGGPIVMNTRKELNKAFEAIEQGTFLQNKIKYE